MFHPLSFFSSPHKIQTENQLQNQFQENLDNSTQKSSQGWNHKVKASPTCVKINGPFPQAFKQKYSEIISLVTMHCKSLTSEILHCSTWSAAQVHANLRYALINYLPIRCTVSFLGSLFSLFLHIDVRFIMWDSHTYTHCSVLKLNRIGRRNKIRQMRSVVTCGRGTELHAINAFGEEFPSLSVFVGWKENLAR